MKLRLPRRRRRIRWTFNTLLVVLGLIVFVAYTWQLGSLTPGLSPAEATSSTASLSGAVIMENPLYAPHKALQYVAHKLSGSPGSLRIASVVFAFVIIVCFYFVAKRWFGRTVSLLATLLLASSPWMLIHGHSATPYILLTWPICILAAFLWLRTTNKHAELATIAVAATLAIGIYIPGVVWMILLGVVLASRQGIREVKQQCSKQLYLVTAGALLLASIPLILALVNNPSLLKDLLLIPDNFPDLSEFLRATGWAAIGVIWRTRDNLDTTIANLPMLDMLGVVLFVLGTISLFTQYRRWRSWWLLGSVILSCIIVGLFNNPLLLLLALPAVMLIIGIGLDFLHREWFSVFPRNPIAKYAALSVMSVAVAFSVIYGFNYSLVAWPRAPETTSVYVIQ